MIDVIVSILLIVILAWLDAWSFKNGFFDKGIHYARFTGRILLFTFFALVFFGWKFIFFSLLLWVTSFDIILNLFRGLHWNYLGTESGWDKMWSSQKTILNIIRVVSLLGSIAIAFKV